MLVQVVSLWQKAQEMARERARQLADQWPLLFQLAPAEPLLALPEPAADMIKRRQRVLGVIPLEGENEVVVVRVYPGRPTDPLSAVGTTTAAPDLHRALQTGVPWLTFLNRALPVNTAAFAASLRRASEQLSGGAYEGLLEAIATRALPSPTHPLVAREGVVWAPVAFCTAVAGSSALIDAEAVSYADYGQLVFRLLTRRPRGNGVVAGNAHPLLDIPSADLWLERHYYRYQGSVFGIWSFTPRDAQSMIELQALDVDILTHFENIGGALWAICLLRGSGPDEESLRELESEIAAFGTVGRISSVHALPGRDLESAFRAFVPGGSSPIGNRFSVGAPEEFLLAAVSGIDSRAAVAGNTLLGTVGEKPVFVNRGPVAVIGPTDVGKTTFATAQALQSSPFGLVIHFTSVAGEASPVWAKDFGGQVLSPTFPAGANRVEEEEKIRAWQYWSETFWKQASETWDNDPLGAAGLPLVLRRDSGSPVQFAALARVFLLGFLEAWKARYALVHQPGFVVLDDLFGIPGAANDITLGTLPGEVGAALRETIRQLVDEGRKSGLMVILTAHSREEFAAWPKGTLESLPYLVVLEPDSNHSEARLVDPRVPEGSGNLLVFDPRLPRTVVERLGGPVGLNLPAYPEVSD